MFVDRRYQEIAGVTLLLCALMILLSLLSYSVKDLDMLTAHRPVSNLLGPFGAWLGHSLRTALGFPSFLLAASFVVSGWCVVRKGSLVDAAERVSSLSVLLVTSSALVALVYSENMPQYAGGYVGLYLALFFERLLGSVGAHLVVIILNVMGLILLGALSLNAVIAAYSSRSWSWSAALKNLYQRIRRRKDKSVPLSTIADELEKREKKPPWIERKRVKVFPKKFTYREESASGGFGGLLEYEPRPGDVPDRDDPRIEFLPGGGEVILLEEEKPACFAGTLAEDEPVDASFENAAPLPGDSRTGEAIGDGAGPAQIGPLLSNRLTIVGGDEEVFDGAEISTAAGPAVRGGPAGRGGEAGTSPARRAKDSPGKGGEVQRTFDFNEEGFEGGEGGTPRIFEEIALSSDYIVPTAFLQSSSMADADGWKNEIMKNSELLVTTLRDFGIESRVVNVNRGPVLTLYEMQIAPGIKVNRIVGLSDDIAMALAGSRVRIVAPIPGKSAIGVEVPNRKRELVMLGDVIGSREYQTQSGFLKVGLGKDILGKPVTLDLKKLPHLLIAGATGSGKSVCVNAIITSLLYNYDPNYVRFILVDPKMVELQSYNGIPHLLTPVITEPNEAPKALKWAMYEMERRYRLLSELNTRDIERYNHKTAGYGDAYERLPYILIVMDELADLMMVASKEIEGFITRISQKARAVGIHMVLATQRPSVDVITGVIKANFPARIAFQVAQKTDSRTIIDQNGAEKLLGKGDMLYQSPMSSFPVRIQGAYITEEEIQAIVQHLRHVGSPEYIDIDKSIFDEDLDGDENEAEDELFLEALKIIEETKKASASYLQRRLSIGYNRAARIIELMEERGYISAQQGSKPREVYI